MPQPKVILQMAMFGLAPTRVCQACGCVVEKCGCVERFQAGTPVVAVGGTGTGVVQGLTRTEVGLPRVLVKWDGSGITAETHPSQIDRKEVKAKLEKNKDIARLDQPEKKTHGWYVRVRFKGTTYCKFFSDKKAGGRQVALLAAISWRNAKERELGKPRTDRHMVTAGNTGTTGIIGVVFDQKRARYVATWVTPEGKQGKTSVSILKHGREKAFEIASKIRAEKETLRISTRLPGKGDRTCNSANN